MAQKTQQGYLLIGDISGFTSYLAKVELEHAHEILTDLLETIVKEFRTLMTISKLEGDAVFAYVNSANIPDGETIVELIENTYMAFRRKRDISENNTTCSCKACSAIPSLDLKFFTHHGDYIAQKVSGIHELVGSDVNLIHRLVKNHVTENTGWNAYMLFTAQAIEILKLGIEDFEEQKESYDHLGDIQIYCLDLHARFKALIEAKRVFISRDDADGVGTFDFDHPAQVVWHWLTDIEKRTLVNKGKAVWSVITRPNGRNGLGAINHCAHGKNLKKFLVETVLDWRPFEYYTIETIEGNSITRSTIQLEPILEGAGTRLHVHYSLSFSKIPRFIRRLLLSFLVPNILKHIGRITAKLMAEELATKSRNAPANVSL
ncbi:MAG: DUF2652 domain-containing protein [Anaerolineae bacterium]|nr:DUF2652 domain-containing protein [Anaerolineae bacterium]